MDKKISLGNAEDVEILNNELKFVKEKLATELNQFTTLANTDAAFVEAFGNYTEQMRRLYGVVEILGLEGLQTVFNFVIDNVTALTKADVQARSKAKKVLETWSDVVLAYLRSPNKNVTSLVIHFRASGWAQPLNDEEARALLNQLIRGSSLEKTDFSHQTSAQPEDVIIQENIDIDQELWEAYLQETPENTASFSAIIQDIIQHPDFSKIRQGQRIAHGLLGSSRIVGVKGIANIALHLEEILEYLAEHQLVPPEALIDTMAKAADCLEKMVKALLDGQHEAPPETRSILQSLLDWRLRIEKG